MSWRLRAKLFMTEAREHKPRKPPPPDKDGDAPAPKRADKKHVSELLDEIDDILEEVGGEAFVKAYVQKGGQ